MPEPKAPTRPGGRLVFIDSLRGFALFGVFWANLLIFSGIAYMSGAQRSERFPGSFDDLLYFAEELLVENKFMGLFSVLFGISFWLFISRAKARGPGGTQLFYRRIGWLLAIGLIHGGLLWCFDILRFYALWALLLPLFLAMSARRLLAAALACCVVLPAAVAGVRAALPPPAGAAVDFDAMALAAFSSGTYLEALVANLRYDGYLTFSLGQVEYQVAVFGRLLFGLWVARALDLGDLGAYRSAFKKVLLGGGAIGLLGGTVFTGHLLSDAHSAPALSLLRRFLVESGQLGLTLAYASGLALLFFHPRFRSAVELMASMGRMALTWYLAQTVFGIWLFYGFAPGPSLMGQVGPASLTAVAVAGFAVQVALARVWLRRFRFGPAEWLWRSATYWKIQPLRIRAARSAAPA